MTFSGSGTGLQNADDVLLNNTSDGDTFKYDTTSQKWKNDPNEPLISSVNTKTGTVTLDKTDIGLANIDNTSDSDKPISAATQTAIDGKVGVGELIINAADYASLGDAINAAAAEGAGLGATVYLPPGTHSTTGVILPANVSLRGAGQRATRLVGEGAVTTLTLSTNCVVSNMTISGDGTPGSVVFTAIASSHHWSVKDCWLTGCETGVLLTNTYVNNLTRVTVQACTTGLLITGANVNAIYVIGTEIKGCGTGVYCDSSSTSTNVVFYGSTIEGNTAYGIHQAGSPYSMSIRDCYFEANITAHIYQTVQSRGLVVSGCSFSGASETSIDLNAGLDTLIEGCNFNSTGTTTSIQCGAQVQRTTLLRNWYHPSQDFASANYSGTGLLVLDREISFPASTPALASINIPHGTAPASPKNGDIWTTTMGMFVCVNGITKSVNIT